MGELHLKEDIVRELTGDFRQLTGKPAPVEGGKRVTAWNQRKRSPSTSGKKTGILGPRRKGMTTKGLKVKKVALVDSGRFALVMGIVVCVNVVTIGLETDMGYANPDLQPIFATVNNGFLMLYITELMLRLIYGGINMFKDTLTILDMFLVIFAFIERVMTDRGVGRSLPCLRLFRVFKSLTRMRYFRHARELWITTGSISRMIVTLSWCCVVLGLFVGAMGTFSRIVLGDSAEWVGTMDPLEEHEPFEPFDNREYFGSVSRSVFTLMQIVTLAQWADHVARPVAEVYPLMALFFFCLVCLTAYGVLKGLISNMLMDSMTTSRLVNKAMEQQFLDDRRLAGEQASIIFKKYDVNGDGTLELDELEDAMKGNELPRILRELEVPHLDAESLILLFDKDGNGYVDYKEVVEGLALMSLDVQPSDIAMLGIWVWSLLMKTKSLTERLAKVQVEMNKLVTTLQGGFVAVDRFLKTKDSSEIRRKALKMIRDAGPETLPMLIGTVQEPERLPMSDLAGEFINFARRFLGESPQVSSMAGRRLRNAASSSGDEDMFSYRSPSTLPDAPQPFVKQVARAKAMRSAREYRPMQKYDMQGCRPSASLTQLRELLSMSP
jgi:hypothetical protein